MNPHRLDLDLLRVLVAVYETGSLTRAAARLFVTQPTVSYGVGKLRDAFGDPLFIRSASGMLPTVKAQALYRQCGVALGVLDAALESANAFDPATTTRRFCIAMSDIGGQYLLPPLFASFQANIPHAGLEVVHPPQQDVNDGLATGAIDAALGNIALSYDDLDSTVLFREHYVCLLARNHPVIRRKLTLEAYVKARHVSVASPFATHQMVENALRERGITRTIGLRIPHFSILPGLIANSDLLVTLPSRVASVFVEYGHLQALALPVDLPEFDVRMHTHKLHAANGAIVWLRKQIVAALGSL